MNKQELIERVKEWGSWLVEDGEKDRYVKISKVRELINQLDEPQKVEIPKFVAEYMKKQRNCKESLRQAMHPLPLIKSGIAEWFEFYENQELFARAWLDGYEVEEPTWVVKYYSKDLERECYFSMAYGTKGFDIDFASRTTLKVNAFKFESKEKAEALALLIDGKVELYD